MKAKASLRFFVFSAISVLVFGTVGFAQSQDAQSEKPQEKKPAALQKSLIIPGWGQLSERKYFKAAAFFSSECLCVFAILRNNHKGNMYYDLYKRASTAEDATKYRKLTERYDKRRNQFFLTALGVWAVNLVDTYGIVKKRKGERGKLGLKLDVSQEMALSLSLHYHY